MRKERASVPIKDLPEMCCRYQAGESTVDLARHYGVTPPTIAYQLKKHRVRLRTRSETNRMRAPVDESELRRLNGLAELSQREIAQHFGVSLPTLSARCDASG